MSKDAKKRYLGLLAGELSEGEVEKVRQDLKSGNNELEDFIENRDLDKAESEMLDSLKLALPKKLRVKPFSNTETDDLYQNIVSAMSARPMAYQARPSWRMLRFSIAASLAIGALIASLVIFYLVPRKMQPNAQIKIKDEISSQQVLEGIRLMFNIGKHEKGRPIVIERGVPGEKYVVEDDVLIRYELKKAGYVCLGHRLPSGEIRILNKNFRKLQKAGWHEIKEAGRVMAVALAGLPGTHSFYGIFKATPFECVPAIEEIVTGLYESDTIVDSFSIEVE
jgi:hypothetical protein